MAMFHRIPSILFVACIVALGAFFSWKLWPEDASANTVAVADVQQQTTLVTLPQQKLESAGIQVATARESSFQPTRTLAGRLDYDQDRHVAVKSACQGILTKILVRPGNRVTAGQVVAIVSSPQLGNARSIAAKGLAELKLARTQFQWQKSLCEGVEELVGLIRDGKSPDDIEQRLKNEALGEYREKLVSAYTRSRLATQLAVSSRDAASRGAVSGRLQQQRESEQQASEAAVEGVLEQSLFEAKQLCKVSEAKLADAELQLKISLQELNTLLGPAAKEVSVADLGNLNSDLLSQVHLVSPIEGTVEERLLSATERVSAGDTIFTIADTTHLWAVADIREHDWSAINVEVGQKVQVATPAIPNETYDGRILIVGRRIDPATGAAPLIAALQGSDSRLRPGLFIRMTVPAGPSRTSLAVPQQAVVVHEDKAFVFVPESERNYRRVDVEVGATGNGLTEITSGLNPGDQIAVAGVFKLKSELLLAGEEE
jgi:cobalt-zinc-cadmium efflux system membrane fusion protein